MCRHVWFAIAAAIAAAVAAAVGAASIAASNIAANAAGAVHSRLCRVDGGLGEHELRRVGRVRRFLSVLHAVEYLRHHALHRGD